ncbi:MAG: peptidylprolyl isomerase [Pseudomonadota bacterium]
MDITQRRGISPATIRDFFTAGVAWRSTVRARFGEQLRTSVDQEDARRGLALNGTDGGTRVLLSEIILPAATPESERASMSRAETLSLLTEEDEFAAAARRFSVAPTSSRGGQVAWVDIDSLPDAVRPVIQSLQPGAVSRPIKLIESIGVFLLRDIEQIAAGTPESLEVDYALFVVGGGPSAAAEVAGRVDVCDDLYGIAKGLPEERLIRETRPAANLAPDIRAALARLDEGEISTEVTRGGNATVLMLCERSPDAENTVDLEIAGNRILNARLGTAAAHYLAQLRAETDILDLTSN